MAQPGIRSITLNAADFLKLADDDYREIRDLSPYANFTEKDVINHLSNKTLLELIENSSYFKKRLAKTTKLFVLDREQLVKYYQECRDYATQSIINSLYPVDQLTEPVQHLDCRTDEFYILSRVRTNAELPTIEETAKERTYLSFTLTSHLNLSHFPGKVWYGYRKGITADMIGLIYPMDADTRSWARNRTELGAGREMLLDAEDLTEESLRLFTYSQISVKANKKAYVGPVITEAPVAPDCVLCIDKIDELSQKASDEQKLPILVLHPRRKTLCHIYDFYHTPAYANPKYM